MSVEKSVFQLAALAEPQLLATLANSRSISGATFVKPLDKRSNLGFLISSINVTNSPHGCGRFAMSLSRRTLVICSRVFSSEAFSNRFMLAKEKYCV